MDERQKPTVDTPHDQATTGVQTKLRDLEIALARAEVEYLFALGSTQGIDLFRRSCENNFRWRRAQLDLLEARANIRDGMVYNTVSDGLQEVIRFCEEEGRALDQEHASFLGPYESGVAEAKRAVDAHMAEHGLRPPTDDVGSVRRGMSVA